MVVFCGSLPFGRSFFGTKFHGVLFGTVMFFGALGGTLGPVIIGRLFDVYRSYDHAFALLIAFTLFGFVLTLGLKNPETGQFESEPGS